MKTIQSPAEIFELVERTRRSGQVVGLVPTMGALHQGHLSLVRRAKQVCDFVVATIFVNPTQFAPGEDLDAYPRPLNDDLRKLQELDTDAVFCPSNADIYPPGFSTFVDPPKISLPFEGSVRQSHFRGVATIVLKLFHMAPADRAFFGQKDYQQTLVVKRMVEDLNVPIRVEVCPIVREADGLAMSSRNVYLSPEERSRATCLFRVLSKIKNAVETGNPVADAVESGRAELEQHVDRLDYLEVVQADTLNGIDASNGQKEPSPLVALVAARIGATRLIDNVLIER